MFAYGERMGILADANSIAQQALANIRTVYSFNGEERTSQAYSDSLQDPLRVGVKPRGEPTKAAWGVALMGLTEASCGTVLLEAQAGLLAELGEIASRHE